MRQAGSYYEHRGVTDLTEELYLTLVRRTHTVWPDVVLEALESSDPFEWSWNWKINGQVQPQLPTAPWQFAKRVLDDPRNEPERLAFEAGLIDSVRLRTPCGWALEELRHAQAEEG